MWCTFMLSFVVFANQNPRLSAAFPRRVVLDRRCPHCSRFSRPPSHYIGTSLLPCFLFDRHLDRKPVNATPLVPADYKCPLAQLLSLHILANAPGVWGSALPFLRFHFNFSPFSRLITCDSPLFLPFLFRRLRTLPSSVSCKSFPCHSYENCRVYTNKSHSGTRSLPSRVLAPKALSGHNVTGPSPGRIKSDAPCLA